MSLKISNLATDKQKTMLTRLGYHGRGQYAIDKLSIAGAAELINELFEEERLTKLTQGESYGDLFDLIDPFNQINK